MVIMNIIDYYKDKKVLVTGHTGFKGSWLCRILHMLGADIYGYSLEPPTCPNLYGLINSDKYVKSCIGDISNFDKLIKFYKESDPDIVFHLAAQPLVGEGYKNPHLTYETNVMGTVNILECVRLEGAHSFLNVTTDKVYDNIEDYSHYYREDERLDGFDPYSNSKSCSELVTHSYYRSFLHNNCPISTARAGNVIGGGDFAPDRIIPDCVRSATIGSEILIRNPNSIRPYQHVLEPLYCYLVIAMKQHLDNRYEGSYNIGPEREDCITTGELANLFCSYWGNGLKWKSICKEGPHEANYLKLDNTKIKNLMGIVPLWHVDEAVNRTVEWTKCWHLGNDVERCTDSQITDYLRGRGLCLME